MFDRNLMKLPGMRAVMGALVVLALLQAALVIAQASGLAGAICTLRDTGALETAMPQLAQFVICFAVLQLVRFAQETMLDRHSAKVAASLRDELLAATFDGRALLARKLGATRVALLANDGIDEVQTYVRIIPPKAIGLVALCAPLLVFEFLTDWVSGVILAIMFPVIIFFMVLLGRLARDRSERQYAAYTQLANRFMDTLRGLRVVKALGASRVEERAAYENSEKLRRATVDTLRTATLSSAVLDLCATFGAAAVAIMLAFRLMDGSLPLFTGLAALIVAPEYFSPVRAFASDFHASLDGKNSLAAILDALGQADAPETMAAPLPEREFSLAFENVSYQYGDAVAGIDGISFALPRFAKVGIIGKSGAGKTTLANLLAGFAAPDEGVVRIDGEAADLTGDPWKQAVRYIPQHPSIFRASLLDNVRFYAPEADREAVEAAIRAVGLDELVGELEDGLDTLVGEGARGLSGGEAHRVALARILLDDDARVLVFDEPTAHLDIETERELKGPMLEAMEGKLVFFATHRLHWTCDLDAVIDLDRGGELTWRAMP